MEYYTYAYLREDGTPYYVGKGKGRRAFLKHGSFYPPPKKRILFLKRNLTEKQAFIHEVYMISVFGRKDLGTGILHNKTDGGDGCSGKIMTEKDIENRRKGRLGKPLSESHKRKIAEANRGTPKTMTEKRKQSDIEKGLRARGKLIGDKNPTKRPEVRKKISDSCKGRNAWNKGISNPNITGGRNPRARKLCYNGVVYDSIKDAVRLTGKTKYHITTYSSFL
jgi:NUMOD3 motif